MKGKVIHKAVGLGLAVVAFAMAVRGASAAGRVHVSTMPESAWLDTEVSTNVTFNSSGRELRKIDVDMQFVGSPTNNVQVAFGRDADSDGDLSDDEAQLVFGWKSGCRFLSLPFEECRVSDGVPAQEAGARRLHVVAQFNGRQEPVSFSARDNAQACFADFAAGSHEWSGVESWNICKVTRRGVNEAFESVDVDASSACFVIKLK